MRANARDWRIAQRESVVKRYGFNVPKSGGSDVVREHPGVIEALSVAVRRPIKPIYVQRLVRLIEAVQGDNERDGPPVHDPASHR